MVDFTVKTNSLYRCEYLTSFTKIILYTLDCFQKSFHQHKLPQIYCTSSKVRNVLIYFFIEAFPSFHSGKPGGRAQISLIMCLMFKKFLYA